MKEKLPFLGLMYLVLTGLILAASWAGQQMVLIETGMTAQSSVKAILVLFALAMLVWAFIFCRSIGGIGRTDSSIALSFIKFTFWLLLMGVGLLLFIIVLGMVLGAIIQTVVPALVPTVVPVVGIIALYVFLRFSALLVASANGVSMKFGASWHKARRVLTPWMGLSLMLIFFIAMFKQVALGWIVEAFIQAAFLLFVFITIAVLYGRRAQD